MRPTWRSYSTTSVEGRARKPERTLDLGTKCLSLSGIIERFSEFCVRAESPTSYLVLVTVSDSERIFPTAEPAWRRSGVLTLLLGMLFAIVLGRLYDLSLYSEQFELLRLVEQGYAPGEALDEFGTERGERLRATLELIFRTVVVVSLLVWWRSVLRNWRQRSERAPTSVWGALCWFVPFANWFVPFDFLRAYAKCIGRSAPVTAWQIFFAFMQIAGGLSAFLSGALSDAQSIRNYWYALITEDIFTICAASCMALVVLMLDKPGQPGSRHGEIK
jgi:hypothetical protein